MAQFFNMALLSFLIEVYFAKSDKYVQIFKTGGLVYDIFILFLTASFIPPLLNIINIPSCLKKYFIKKQIQMGSKSTLTQQQMNNLFENPEHDLARSYVLVLKTIYFTAFYSVIIPIGMFVSIIGLILWYWTEKVSFFFIL